MKDESRELIEQYKDMYQKLNEQSIFFATNLWKRDRRCTAYIKEKGGIDNTYYKNHERIGSTGKAK